MKLIKDLGSRKKYNTFFNYGLYECPECNNEFEAAHHDINSKRKRNCGCKTSLREISSIINGFNVYEDLGVIKGRRRALFTCICGGTFNADVSNVKIGRGMLHCGCVVKPKKEKPIKIKAPKPDNLIEKIAKTLSIDIKDAQLLEYTYRGMIRRCYSSTHPKYIHYGMRGISVCDAWRHSLMQFAIDMGCKPSSEYTLDRINNNGNYEPSNCRWATQKTQQNNKRNNLINK